MEGAIRSADVVHVHSLWNGTSSAAMWLARRHRRIIVLSPHGTLDRVGMQRRRALKHLYLASVDQANIAAVNGFHFLDAGERDSSSWLDAVIRRACIVLSNGVDSAGIQGSLRRLPDVIARFRNGASGPQLVSLGRLHEIKGIELQIEVLADLRAGGMPAQLHLVGPDDGDEARLRGRAAALGVSAQVHFHGPLYDERRLAWLRDADAVLLTSFSEAHSMTAAETLAAGGLLVATEGCNLQAAADAEAVLQVPRERQVLADALRRVLAEPRRDSAQRAAAIEHARHCLDWDTLARRMQAFYARLIAWRDAGNVA
jgi:glycosyltransferase involved in cell wall biosynthesis